MLRDVACFSFKFEVVLPVNGEADTGSANDLFGVVSKNLEGKGVACGPGKSDEASTDLVGLATSRLSSVATVLVPGNIDDIPE